jgi:short subunit dehydrogenase-like uncharacterized protein
MSDKFDVIVLGATGYTGQLVCEYLQTRAKDTSQTWAVAGRRTDALEQLASKYGADGIMVADCSSADDCRALAEAGKVIANLAGPYFGRAEGVVEACANEGAHYLDLTGELIFVRDIIDRFHDRAAASGAKIAPVAGYEALPFDLMALKLLETYTDRFGATPDSIDILSLTGETPDGLRGLDQMISGGTAETMRVMLEKDFSRLSLDPTALNPTEDVNRDEIRNAMAYRLRPRNDDLERWSIPIFPGPFLHPAIVNRTNAMLRLEQKTVDAKLRYRERMSIGGGGQGFSKMVIAFVVAGLGRFMGWLTSTSLRTPRKLVKNYMDRNAPKPGEGPDLDKIDDWRWGLKGAARGVGQKIEMQLEGKGHPGYRTTANMIAEAALILADPNANTPDRAGVLTPASALGTAELKRFAIAGMAFSDPA